MKGSSKHSSMPRWQRLICSSVKDKEAAKLRRRFLEGETGSSSCDEFSHDTPPSIAASATSYSTPSSRSSYSTTSRSTRHSLPTVGSESMESTAGNTGSPTSVVLQSSLEPQHPLHDSSSYRDGVDEKDDYYSGPVDLDDDVLDDDDSPRDDDDHHHQFHPIPEDSQYIIRQVQKSLKPSLTRTRSWTPRQSTRKTMPNHNHNTSVYHDYERSYDYHYSTTTTTPTGTTASSPVTIPDSSVYSGNSLSHTVDSNRSTASESRTSLSTEGTSLPPPLLSAPVKRTRFAEVQPPVQHYYYPETEPLSSSNHGNNYSCLGSSTAATTPKSILRPSEHKPVRYYMDEELFPTSSACGKIARRATCRPRVHPTMDDIRNMEDRSVMSGNTSVASGVSQASSVESLEVFLNHISCSHQDRITVRDWIR